MFYSTTHTFPITIFLLAKNSYVLPENKQAIYLLPTEFINKCQTENFANIRLLFRKIYGAIISYLIAAENARNVPRQYIFSAFWHDRHLSNKYTSNGFVDDSEKNVIKYF